MTSIETIAATLRDIMKPGMKPKEIRAAVRDKHPEAHKKEIVRAAFYALAEAFPNDDTAHAHLHSFAVSERGSDETDGSVKTSKRRRRDRS